LDCITFSEPAIKQTRFGIQYTRKWEIPSKHSELGRSFWAYWAANKHKMLVRDFSVAKNSLGKWELVETKKRKTEFKDFIRRAPIETESNLDILPLSDESGLKSWQIPATQRLVSSIQQYGAALDGSDTGCHIKGQLILMFDGTLRCVEDIVINDVVMGWDSTPRTVRSLNIGHQNMVRIEPHNSEPWTVNTDHILTVYSKENKIVDIPMSEYIKLPQCEQNQMRLFSSGCISCWKPKKLPVDPVVMGWLLINKQNSSVFSLLQNFQPFSKHIQQSIPVEYKTAGIQQRCDLLHGILQFESSTNESIDFIAPSAQLHNDVAFIARSLGIRTHTLSDTHKFGLRLFTTLPIKPPPPTIHHKFFFDVQLLDEREYFGFEISGDGRYVLGNFFVTHNTGKTYTAIAVARELKMKIGVICPKSVIESWKRTIVNHFNMEYEFVYNYEAIKGGKYPHILDKQRKDMSFDESFVWNVPQNTLLVFDESHRLKTKDSINAELAKAAKRQNYKILCCSATNAINPLELDAVGFILGLHKGHFDFYRFLRNHDCDKSGFGWQFKGDRYFLRKLHKDMLLDRGVRLVKDDIPEFPESEIITEPYFVDDECSKQIDVVYSKMEHDIRECQKTAADPRKMEITIRLRNRQKIELLKVPLLVEMTNDLIEDGNSVVIMVNFTETIKLLSKKLKTKCIVWGDNKQNERQEHIDSFQSDAARIILINIAAGGVGISLHDINGKYPRVALISPNDSAPILRQSFGRVHRAGAKSKSQQRVIYIANTVEEDVCNNVKLKLKNLDLINDGDLNPKFEGMLHE